MDLKANVVLATRFNHFQIVLRYYVWRITGINIPCTWDMKRWYYAKVNGGR